MSDPADTGLAIEAASGLAVQGVRAFYRWTATTAAGESFAGVDFVEFAPDGRIERVTNFYEESRARHVR